jgi:hypothetical protein
MHSRYEHSNAIIILGLITHIHFSMGSLFMCAFDEDKVMILLYNKVRISNFFNGETDYIFKSTNTYSSLQVEILKLLAENDV